MTLTQQSPGDFRAALKMQFNTPVLKNNSTYMHNKTQDPYFLFWTLNALPVCMQMCAIGFTCLGTCVHPCVCACLLEVIRKTLNEVLWCVVITWGFIVY